MHLRLSQSWDWLSVQNEVPEYESCPLVVEVVVVVHHYHRRRQNE